MVAASAAATTSVRLRFFFCAFSFKDKRAVSCLVVSEAGTTVRCFWRRARDAVSEEVFLGAAAAADPRTFADAAETETNDEPDDAVAAVDDEGGLLSSLRPVLVVAAVFMVKGRRRTAATRKMTPFVPVVFDEEKKAGATNSNDGGRLKRAPLESTSHHN
jgi:hypothetical protein